MKITSDEIGDAFRPVKIVMLLENVDELMALWYLSNLSVWDVTEGYDGAERGEVKGTLERTDVQGKMWDEVNRWKKKWEEDRE